MFSAIRNFLNPAVPAPATLKEKATVAPEKKIVPEEKVAPNYHALANTFLEAAIKQYISMFEGAQFTLIVLNIGLESIPSPNIALSKDAQRINSLMSKEAKNLNITDVDGYISTVDTTKSDLAKHIVSKVKNTNNPAIIFLRAANAVFLDDDIKKLLLHFMRSFDKCFIGIEFRKMEQGRLLTMNGVNDFCLYSGLTELESTSVAKLVGLRDSREQITPDMREFVVATFKK